MFLGSFMRGVYGVRAARRRARYDGGVKRRALVATLALVVVAAVVATIGFIDGHPGQFPSTFQFGHDWRGALVARTEGADGIRIHGSDRDRTWLFQSHEGTVLFETHDANLTREFLDLVRIDDLASGGHCCCVGGTEIDVFRGSSVATSFLVKHGRELRSGLLWPGDAQLTADSAEAVCAWLVAHGVDEESPRTRTARIAAETKARDAAQDALLGPGKAQALRACPDEASVGALLAGLELNATDRIVVALRFLALEPSGEPSGANDAGAQAYVRVERWLSDVDDPAALAAAFGRLLEDDAIAPVVAYRFAMLDHLSDRPFSANTLPGLRIAAARILLSSSEEYRRKCGVETLGRMADTPAVRALLLGLLPPAGDVERAAAPTTDDQMAAASLVIRFCDPSMFPRLQAMTDVAKDSGRWSKRIARRIAARLDPADSDPLDDTLDVLPRSPMEGVVRTADGTAVAGASVRLTDPRRKPVVGEFFTWTVRTDTDERGRYRLDVPVGRRWHVSVVHADHPYLLRRDADLRVPPPTMDLVLPKERKIRGRVVDADGRAIAGAAVFATRQSPFDTHADECGVTAAQDGTFEIGGFDADAPEIRVTLHLHAPGEDHDPRTSEWWEFTVRPGEPPVELRRRARK